MVYFTKSSKGEMMKLCKNCRYWRKSFDEEDNSGNCKCPKIKYDFEFRWKKVKNSDKAYYYDASGYAAWFVTGENFGCIHFKEK